MPHKIVLCALAGALAAAGASIGERASSSVSHRHVLATEVIRQQAYFEQRLTQIGARIDRQERAGLISQGPATFMRQDLSRIRADIGRLVQQGEALSPQEHASYCAMLRRVELRLIPARAMLSRRAS